jgi:hypothetical protein
MMTSEVKQRSVSKLSSAEVLQRLTKLEGEISIVEPKTDHAATTSKRKLWCSLEELRLDYNSSDAAKQEARDLPFATPKINFSSLPHSYFPWIWRFYGANPLL